MVALDTVKQYWYILFLFFVHYNKYKNSNSNSNNNNMREFRNLPIIVFIYTHIHIYKEKRTPIFKILSKFHLILIACIYGPVLEVSIDKDIDQVR